jgi:uncharacterized protein (TIGR02594 family)
MNFSVTGNGPSGSGIAYDLNGNILSMQHYGVKAGQSTPVVVDDLRYRYAEYSNRLSSVHDEGNLGTSNGQLGDFKDGTNDENSQPDYLYDDNGNLVLDLNKQIKGAAGTAGADVGIKYNYLDKPEEIRIEGKGMIKIVYDADGTKLQKIFTPQQGGASVTTSYISSYVYRGDALQYINFEEGRIRVMEMVNETNGFDFLSIDGNMSLPGGKRGAYDYFISDYQQNVRMILTEQTHVGGNTCTMEQGRAANEEPVFGQIDGNGNPSAANEVAARFAVSQIPGQGSGNGWTNSSIANHVSRLGNLATSKVGPNTLLRVMAGDEVDANAIYYYKQPVSNSNQGNAVLPSMLLALTNVISSSVVADPLIKSSAAEIASLLSGSGGIGTPLYNATSPDAGGVNDPIPKAYLTVLFFDERFNFIGEGSATDRVDAPGNGSDRVLVIDPVKAPRNGYAFVYLSNESDEHVYFDNLKVQLRHGHIIEENHYYAYGLRIAGISSRKMGDAREGQLANPYQYQGDYSEFDDETGWNDFALRSYDPQTGRFINADPYDQFASGYVGMGNDPVNNTDPSGGFSVNFGSITTLGRIGVAAGGAAVGFAIDKLSGGNGWAGAAIGGGLALGATFIKPFDIGAIFKGTENGRSLLSMGVHSAELITKSEINDIPSSISPPPNIKINLPNPTRQKPKATEVPWMKIAKTQLGISELTGNNDGTDVEKYLKSVGLGKGQPWCGAFVNWNLNQVGIPGVKKASWALSWRGYGQKLSQPAYGSIATKTRNGGGHVGFVAGITSNGRIVLLGGNQGDKVKYESFPASQLKYNYPSGYSPNYNLPIINAGANVRMY